MPGESRYHEPTSLTRPAFVAIISSHILAKSLHKKASGRVDGFVVENVGINPTREVGGEARVVAGGVSAALENVDDGLREWHAGVVTQGVCREEIASSPVKGGC